MNQARLIWVGRANRRAPERELCSRYTQRIGHYLRFDEQVVKPMTDRSEEVLRGRESERIRALLADDDYTILCDERGQQLTSQRFADLITHRRQAGTRRLVWVIGGAMGVDVQLRQRANFVLSLSKMTLPHALARVLLLEQLYRALTISAGHPYHHEG
jgi:23S rRNA (pseudouridine1915-N3)-methyltransferase